MKFLQTEQDRFIFQVGITEKGLLFGLLKHYPLVPPGRQPLSKTMDPDELRDDQQLLEESLAEAKRENGRRLAALLTEAGRFQSNQNGYRLTLTGTEIDWLLQVLNDIRVGSWVALGSPDQSASRDVELTDETAPYWWALELSGMFQMVLLDALDRGS